MLHFVATECGSKVEYDTLICGASNSNGKDDDEWHSFILMRALPGAEEDDGPYFELDDQSQGFHNVVRRVCFAGNVITVSVVPRRGDSLGHRTIVAELRCPKVQIVKFKRGVQAVFRDHPHVVVGV
jgi:hypothetical protein